jgi:hypothetical protein
LSVQNAMAGVTGLVLASVLSLLSAGMLIWALDFRLTLGLFDSLRKVFPGLPLRWPLHMKPESHP